MLSHSFREMVDYTWDQGEGEGKVLVLFSYFMYVTLMLPSRLILDIYALFQMVLDSLRVAVDVF